MAFIASIASKLVIWHASGRLTVKATDGGLWADGKRREAVIVQGTQPRSRVKWYREMVKLARTALKHGKARYDRGQGCWVVRWNKEVALHMSERPTNQGWALKLLQAAEDVIRREGRRPEREIAIPVPVGGAHVFQTKAGGQYRLSNPRR